jgi:23S rRNA (cytidine1920-2'-O)/16S rRNA (cytidine1409-2'-O)-methyltransferase
VTQKKRLDLMLFEKGMVASRSLAQRMVMAGEIRVNGEMVIRPSHSVSEEDEIVIQPLPRYVSRGGEKLAKALHSFNLLDLSGKVCADVGSSTGGFTDCLMQHGASRIYAIDVGKGLLHWKLRNDPRVIAMEENNARFILSLPEPIDLVTIDASFISLKTLLPVIKNWLNAQGKIIALIKPQFEAGRELAAKGRGVIRDPIVHQEILRDMILFCLDIGLEVLDLEVSPILGPKGNREFLFLSQKQLVLPKTSPDEIIEELVYKNHRLQIQS